MRYFIILFIVWRLNLNLTCLFIHSKFILSPKYEKTVLYTNKYNVAIKETANGPYRGLRDI